MTRISFLILFVSALTKSAAANEVLEPLKCDLKCSNGGYCTLKDGDPETLGKYAQSGTLIEVCVCQPGFTGVACENTVQACKAPERTCHNGMPCELDSTSGEWECNCALADSINSFAGKMCRNPATEYCTGRFQPNSDLSFCTNGGRCLADFIAAQIAPGDTTVNRAYQHAGCACPPEFYGPHCEFLRLNGLEQDHMQGPAVDDKAKHTFPIAGFMLGGALILVSIVMVLVFRRRYYHTEPSFSDSESDSDASGVEDMELDHGNGQWMIDTGVPASRTDEESDIRGINSYSDISPPDSSTMMRHFPKHFPPTPEMI